MQRPREAHSKIKCFQSTGGVKLISRTVTPNPPSGYWHSQGLDCCSSHDHATSNCSFKRKYGRNWVPQILPKQQAMLLHCCLHLSYASKQNVPVRAAEAQEKVYNARNSPSREMPLQIPGIHRVLQCKPKTILHISEGIILILFMAL